MLFTSFNSAILYFKCSGFYYVCHVNCYFVPFAYTCGGKHDCPMGDDDDIYAAIIFTGPTFAPAKCHESIVCVTTDSICDGFEDCPYGDDEFFCFLAIPKCPQNCICLYFKCPGFYCLPWRFVCNGQWECPGGMEERNCQRTACPGMFKCKNTSICISTQSLCDFLSDCHLNDDENFCPIGKVSQKCPSNCSCSHFTSFCKDVVLEWNWCTCRLTS